MPCSAYTQDCSPYWDATPHVPANIPKKNFGDTYDHQMIIKVQLRNRLNNNQLSNMPGGFPFHHVFDGRGSAYLSYDSYEFREEFLISSYDQHAKQTAIITFTSPNSSRNKDGYLTWRASLPSLDPSYCRSSSKIPIAHVQVDPSVMNSPYGCTIKKEPKIILRALAISLELGVQITIQLWDPSIASRYLCKRDTILYTGKYHTGKEEILFAFTHK